jgi:hypothetical protein
MQRGMSRVGALLSHAHAQDFERKRRRGVEDENSEHEVDHDMHNSSSDEDEEDAMDEENQHEIADAESLMRRHGSRRRS